MFYDSKGTFRMMKVSSSTPPDRERRAQTENPSSPFPGSCLRENRRFASGSTAAAAEQQTPPQSGAAASFTDTLMS